MADDRWISCKDRLPDNEEPEGDWGRSANVLIAAREDDETQVDVGYLFFGCTASPNGYWNLSSGEELWGAVTHWQPLPSVEGL